MAVDTAVKPTCLRCGEPFTPEVNDGDATIYDDDGEICCDDCFNEPTDGDETPDAVDPDHARDMMIDARLGV